MMTCPRCPETTEVAYSALTERLVCLSSACNWERPLDADEIHALFFGSRIVRAAASAEKALTPTTVEVSFWERPARPERSGLISS